MTCTIEVISDAAALRRIAPVWDALVARSGVTHPFTTHAWMETWWESFGEGELMILLVRCDGEPVAIAPLQRTTERIYGAKHRCIRFLANAHSPRCDFIVAEKHAEVYAAIRRFLTGFDVLQLTDVPNDSRTILELTSGTAELLVGIRRGPKSPVLRTERKWSEYFETLAPKRRWFLRNRLKKLAAHGSVTLETVTSADPIAVEDGFRLEAAAWKADAGTAIICDPRVRQFYTTLAQRAADRGWLRLQFLKTGERRIAFAYCLEFDRRMFLLKPGFDPDYAQYSPGNLLFYLALQELHAAGLEAYEFLGYDDDWKRQWADEFTGHSTLFLYTKQPLTRLDHYTKFALMPRLRRARDFVFRNH